jgi:enediyne biosynthesis protein E4
MCILLSVGCNRKSSTPATNSNTIGAADSQSSATLPSQPSNKLPSADRPQPASEPAVPSSRVLFTQVQDEMGFEHVFDRGAQGKLLEVETLGGGCGWIDYDMDGRLDILGNQGGDPTVVDRSAQPADGLYRNLGDRFQRVDAVAGLVDCDYSQAIAVADFDNDGFPDVYISNVFANTMWKNCGDGTFLEVAASAGVADPRWSTTSAWADIDLDGDLDLYVCNYLVYDPTNAPPCYDDQGRLVLCNPSKLEPWPDACYINQGDGTFIEQSRELGLIGEGSRALSVAIADFNNDRLPDIYVANDTNDNFLFVNQGKGKFEEQAKLYGCATDYLGMPQASMGLAINDFDRNGFLDIYSTHYTQESNTLYENYGHGFQDVTARMGLHQPTLAYLGFGTVMQDFDQNGEMELFVANGHVATAPHQAEPRMKPQLFSYTGRKQWRDISRDSGPTFQQARLSRGVASADFDEDGDLDLLVLNLNDRTWLLRNDSERGAWLTLAFIGQESNRYGIGVRAEVTAGDRTYVQEVCGGTSFASANQPLLAFGLGEFVGEVNIRILWPLGKEQLLTGIPLRQHLVVREARSKP